MIHLWISFYFSRLIRCHHFCVVSSSFQRRGPCVSLCHVRHQFRPLSTLRSTRGHLAAHSSQPRAAKPRKLESSPSALFIGWMAAAECTSSSSFLAVLTYVAVKKGRKRQNSRCRFSQRPCLTSDLVGYRFPFFPPSIAPDSTEIALRPRNSMTNWFRLFLFVRAVTLHIPIR